MRQLQWSAEENRKLLQLLQRLFFRKIVPTGYGNEVCKVKKGKKITAGLIFLILMTVLMTALTGCNKTDKITDTTENPVIKIGSDNYPPYNFLNEDGMPTGNRC